MIENEPVSVVIDRGATCNLISHQVFDKVSKGKIGLLKSDRKVDTYAYKQPLELRGKWMVDIFVPSRQTSLQAEFFVMPGSADTLLDRSSSEVRHPEDRCVS